MNDNNKIKYYSEYFKRLIEGVEKSSFHGIHKTKGFLEDGKYFTLTDDHAIVFEKMMKSLLNEQKWIHKFSEKYIENRLKQTIAKLLDNNTFDSIQNETKILLNELADFHDEYIVLVPIEGINLQIDKIDLGKIRLINGTNVLVDELLADINNIIISCKEPENIKNEMIESYKCMMLGTFSKRTCSVVKIIAEPEAAKEKAIEYTRSVIDILRFSLPQFTQSASQMNIGIYGDIIKTERFIPIVKTNKQGFTTKEEVVGPIYPYQINIETIEKMKKSNIYNLFALLDKEESERTDFQNTILRAIHWYASHVTQQEVENKLLNLVTSIEVLLTPRDNSPIGNALAEGVAIIIGDSFEKRKKIKLKIQELWRLRCSISHGGKKYVLEKEVQGLSLLAFFTIVTLISYLDKFKTQTELLNWIEEQKLSPAS